MKKSLIALSVLAATSAFAGGGVTVGGVAINNPAVPVSVNGSGVGDLLIAPLFMANGGWQSEVKIVNTSTVYSTAAKLVFHERGTSTEVLDFLVFLSPGDVWNGVISCPNSSATKGCNGLTITSKDVDSTPQFAPVNGVVTIVQNAATIGADGAPVYANADIGYVNIIESAAWNLGPAPVDKTVIVAQANTDAFAVAAGGGLPTLAQNTTASLYTLIPAGNPTLKNSGPVTLTNTSSGYTGLVPQVGVTALTTALPGVLGKFGYAEVRTAAPLVASTENILAGTVRLENVLQRSVSQLPLVAVQNYRNAIPLVPGLYSGIGVDYPTAAGGASWTTLGALELQLYNNDWVLPFDHALGTVANIASVTFPTRLTFDKQLHGTVPAVSSTFPLGVSLGIYPFDNTLNPVTGLLNNPFTKAVVTVRDQQETILTSKIQVSPAPPPVSLNFTELGFVYISPSAGVVPDKTGYLNVVGTADSSTGVSFANGWVNLNVASPICVQAGSPIPHLNYFATGAGVAPLNCTTTAIPLNNNGGQVNYAGAPALVTQLQLSTLTDATGRATGFRSEWWYPQSKKSNAGGFAIGLGVTNGVPAAGVLGAND